MGGLFVYDIFWVFGTDVMVTVAKSFEAPIKLVFPRDIFSPPYEKFSMLGLGDIVFPGVLIAMLLRFDYARAKATNTAPTLVYYRSGFAAYVVALLCAGFVLHYFQAAQPVMLYIVPACLIFPIVTALSRGELKQLLDYTEQEDAKKNKE
eukprot:TRINITY_DN1515_c0_g1_i2.p1 TRINITY_DN1515_c0_g1~~TRINITY_DN1515_c0_g1_i2.p1  ORF type:complete len:150 (+),score=42.56 TRINITY_DN1515_c0_g1_i2:594-1043(+)